MNIGRFHVPFTPSDDGPDDVEFSQKPTNKSEPSAEERFDRGFKSAVVGLRFNRKIQSALCVALGVLLVVPVLVWRVNSVSTDKDNKIATLQSQTDRLEDQVSIFTNSCASTGKCKTFQFGPAEQTLSRWAMACFNYGQDRPKGEQATRLVNASGPDSCGWQGNGNGASTVTIDSQLRQTILDANGNPRTDIGVVGVRLQMAGQPDWLAYSAVVKYTGSTFVVASPGAVFTTLPTTSVTSCVKDSTTGYDDLPPRLGSLLAGQLGQPNIDLGDYLEPGLDIGKFSTSITNVSVKSLDICRGSSGGNVSFQATLEMAGPTPGATFDFNVAYTARRAADTQKWRITGWGLPVESAITSL